MDYIKIERICARIWIGLGVALPLFLMGFAIMTGSGLAAFIISFVVLSLALFCLLVGFGMLKQKARMTLLVVFALTSFMNLSSLSDFFYGPPVPAMAQLSLPEGIMAGFLAALSVASFYAIYKRR